MEEIEWTIENEGNLLEAMVGLKPIGVRKNFEMAILLERLDHKNIMIHSSQIWAHLKTQYNLENLDEMENLPFPNIECDFELPDEEFGEEKAKKLESIAEEKAKVATPKRAETKDVKPTPKEAKKDEKVVVKKDVTRRDSKDGKETPKLANMAKKEVKKETPEIKPKGFKSRASTKEEEKVVKTPKSEEVLKRINKRPTRLSMKPDEVQKSQSPLTVTPTSTKRRRI